MNDLRQLYQEVILDHGKRPRNFHLPAHASHRAEGVNPLCGDRLTLGVRLDGDVIHDIGFEGAGCAISMASASLMTEAIKGRTRADAARLFEQFHAMVTGRASGEAADALEHLAVFSGVSAYPMRVKCATLCWHTLLGALGSQDGDGGRITTE